MSTGEGFAGLPDAQQPRSPGTITGGYGQPVVPDHLHCWALEVPWRTGRKVRRTVYAMVSAKPTDDDALIGVMDYPAVAEAIVIEHNRSLRDA